MRHKKETRRIVPCRRLRKIAFWPRVVLGIIWALPLSLIGFLIALPVLLLHGRAMMFSGDTYALVVRGRFGDLLLARHPFGVMSAMAIGHVVIVAQDAVTIRILTHELEHVSQAARWGCLFPFAYLAASGWAILHGRDAYWHNRFEVAARNAERHAR